MTTTVKEKNNEINMVVKEVKGVRVVKDNSVVMHICLLVCRRLGRQLLASNASDNFFNSSNYPKEIIE